MAGNRATSFEEFVASRGQALQRFGYLLTSDWGLAEDLMQTALARSYTRWRWIEAENPEAYVRKAMVNTWMSWGRRRSQSEIPAAQLPETAGADEYAASDRRHAIRNALAALPPRQRAILVLRYHLDLTELAVAQLLGISVGAVKSQGARALQKLRADGALADYSSAQPPVAKPLGGTVGSGIGA